uniref:Ntox44 domain-containing protein n=1 Tax=Heterorhabditis bacteriophora TaxID=37862 RepID=A0A1I7X398_HETBA
MQMSNNIECSMLSSSTTSRVVLHGPASTMTLNWLSSITKGRLRPSSSSRLSSPSRNLHALYNIAYAFNSGVGLDLGSWHVNGIPYYPINEEGSIGAGRVANVPFGSWGGGYSENLGVRDYWSQTMEVGANWYEGKYGYKSGWSVPLVQSLGIEGDTHATAGKPIGVDVGGGVGPYYQQNQHVGVDYMNGQVGTNFGVGVPFAGVGVNTGLGISFPSVNDFVG